jgi:gliding motility-associated-like protein
MFRMKRLIFFLFLLVCMNMLHSQVVDAGQNDTICNLVPVQLSATQDSYTNYFYSRWIPSRTLSDSTILNPVASPTTTTTYYFSSYYEDDTNLVYNGDFEMGTAGITSGYVQGFGSSGLYPEGTYAVVHYPGAVHPGFPTGLYDHTYGTIAGNFMAVNGAGTPNTNVWSQTVNVLPNTDYVFYTWVVTMVAADTSQVSQLQFSINNVLIGSVFTAPYPLSLGWQQFYTAWNSGSNTTALIKIVNQNTTLSGNDFGLDDIHFAPIIPATDSVTVYVGAPINVNNTVSICDGTSYFFNGEFLTSPGLYHDTLMTSLGCDSILNLQLYFGDPVSVDLGNDRKFCKDDYSSFTLNPGSYNEYHWSDSSANSSLTVNVSGTYSVTVSDAMGCSASDSVTIEFIDNPHVSIQNNTGDFCEEYFADLFAVTDIEADFLWNTGATDQMIVASSSGKYSVTADNNGCVNTAYYVINPCEYNLYLPNCFTPTGHDGLNDYFSLPNPEGIKSMEIYIYNRFGGLVFFSYDPYFKWDGKYLGKIYTGTIYGYYIKIIPKSGDKMIVKGYVTVL